MIDQQRDKQNRVDPYADQFAVVQSQSFQPDQRLESLESQFDLPSSPIEFEQTQRWPCAERA